LALFTRHVSRGFGEQSRRPKIIYSTVYFNIIYEIILFLNGLNILLFLKYYTTNFLINKEINNK